MQNIFLDIPAGAWKRNPELTDWLEHGQAQTGLLRQHGYDRVLLRTENLSELYDLLETVIFQESMHWILQEEGSYYRHLLEPEAYDDFQRQAKRRKFSIQYAVFAKTQHRHGTAQAALQLAAAISHMHRHTSHQISRQRNQTAASGNGVNHTGNK